MARLELSDVSYRYPSSDKWALDSIDLTVGEGEFIAVAGPSGSGKSTLLRTINSLVPHFFGGEFAGELTLDGLRIREHGPARFAECVGSLFQDPETQIVMSSVRAELAFPLENRGWEGQAIRRAIEEVSLVLGINQLLDRRPEELSGGEMQRVALGAALVCRPRWLVLDEPTSQLDPVLAEELLAFLRLVCDEWGISILLSEHRLDRCLGLVDRVIGMERAKLVFDGSPRDYINWTVGRPNWVVPSPARMFSGVGVDRLPLTIREARQTVRSLGLDLSDNEASSSQVKQSGLGRIIPFNGRRKQNCCVSIKGVTVAYENGSTVLQNLSLDFKPGEAVALLGRNGAGKSTLLRTIGGLVKPSKGRVEVDDRVSILLQNPNDFFITGSVEQEVAQAELDRLGLMHLKDHHPRDLSGGEKQRLAVAAVIAARPQPKLIAFDEPTRGMDQLNRKDLSRLIMELCGQGIAVIVATHDMEWAAEFSDRTILLGSTGVITDGPTREVLIGGMFFSTPTTRVLGGHCDLLTLNEGADWLRQQLLTKAADRSHGVDR